MKSVLLRTRGARHLIATNARETLCGIPVSAAVRRWAIPHNCARCSEALRRVTVAGLGGTAANDREPEPPTGGEMALGEEGRAA